VSLLTAHGPLASPQASRHCASHIDDICVSLLTACFALASPSCKKVARNCVGWRVCLFWPQTCVRVTQLLTRALHAPVDRKPWNYRLCSYAVILAFSNFAWQAEVSILQLYRNRIRTRSRSLLSFTCVSLLTASVPAKWLRWCLRCFLF